MSKEKAGKDKNTSFIDFFHNSISLHNTCFTGKDHDIEVGLRKQKG
jgi:hypothetical protein